MKRALSKTAQAIHDTYETIVKSLTEHHAELKIDVVEMQSSTTITIETHADDHGKVVGSHGAMIGALQKLAGILGTRYKIKIRLFLQSPKVGQMGPRPKFQAAAEWNNEPLRLLALNVCRAIFFKEPEVRAHDAGETTTLEIAPATGDAMIVYLKEIESILSVVFYAIGKSIGRGEVFVDFLPLAA